MKKENGSFLKDGIKWTWQINEETSKRNSYIIFD